MNERIKVYEQAIEYQYHTIHYYGQLQKQMEDSTASILIEQIRKDKMKHLRVLQEIHNYYTGICYQSQTPCTLVCEKESLQEIEKSLFRENENVRMYRSLYFGSTDTPVRDRLYDLVADTQEHAIQLTYLYARLK
ncbi:MAG: ferritin-like domain-containing protein, partial [Epulopiscium sp.]|nr:ferritin-like domain-containing protein [Candidatus Epulonipiscium sp.]